MKRPAATPARSRSPRPRAEINVTPLVDVCLVLLIIFMVVTPLLHPAAGDDRKVVLRADRRLPYRQVKEVARAIRDAGFSRLGLVTRRDGADNTPLSPGGGA